MFIYLGKFFFNFVIYYIVVVMEYAQICAESFSPQKFAILFRNNNKNLNNITNSIG